MRGLGANNLVASEAPGSRRQWLYRVHLSFSQTILTGNLKYPGGISNLVSWDGGGEGAGVQGEREGEGTLPLLTPPISTVGCLAVGSLGEPKKVEKPKKS